MKFDLFFDELVWGKWRFFRTYEIVDGDVENDGGYDVDVKGDLFVGDGDGNAVKSLRVLYLTSRIV